MNNDHLAHRLNRIAGQINGTKNKLDSDSEADCLATLQQLKASINALKKFGEAYMKQHLSACIKKRKNPQELAATLEDVISGAFSL